MSNILVSFSEGSHVVVPLYQRNYDWKKQNCKQLLNDIERLIADRTGTKRHFTGAVIYTNEEMNRVIIDGQQRLTTVHLLLLAIRDAINDGEVQSTDPDTLAEIRICLGKRDSILVPCGKDYEAYQSLYNGKYADAWSQNEYGYTNIWMNYAYLKSEVIAIASGEDFGERLFDAVKRLWIVPIELKENDDPQAVFESINTTGLKLSDSDRIRNFIMMNHSQSDQKRIYEQYWVRIEEYLGDEIEYFFIDFLKSETFNKVKMSNNGMYNTFKEKFSILKDPGDEKWKVLGRIRDYARIYSCILKGDITEYASDEASRAVRYISYLWQRVTYSFILNILGAVRNGELDKAEASRAILITETYIERRHSTNEPTNAMNGLFPSLYRTVRNLPGDAPFSDKLAYLLNSKQGTLWLPTDDYIRGKLATRNIYKNRNVCAIVLAIANHVNNDYQDVLQKMDCEGGYTIDHILPQNPCSEWYTDIPDLDRIKETYLNTIGNLTLTTYNFKFGNKSFEYRLNVPKEGYKNSPLHINEYLKKQTRWGEEQIKERTELIISDFLENRPIMSSHGYSPSVDDVMEMYLSDDLQALTGAKILGFTFDDNPFFPVKNAVDCYVEIMKLLCREHPDKFTEWANDGATKGFSAFIHAKQDPRYNYSLIGPNVYIWRPMSNADKFGILQKTVENLDMDGASISIRFKSKRNSKEQTDSEE